MIGYPPFPWRDLRRLNSLAAQLTTALDPCSGRWVAAFETGNGFFTFRNEKTAAPRRGYVEDVPFPEVQVLRNGNSVETSFRTPPVVAARSISVSPTRLYVLFGGTGTHVRRIVDSYALDGGRYTGSYLLPHVADDIAWGNGGLYVVYNDPYPHMALLRPRGARLP